MNLMTSQRDLNKEAFLWYSLTSPEYLDRAFKRLEKADEFLKELKGAHPLARDFGPATYWGGVIEQLLESYPNVRAMLSHGEFGAAIRWCIKTGDIGRGFREQGMWMNKDQFISLLGKIDSSSEICADFLRATAMTMYFSSQGILSGEEKWTEYDRDDGYRGSSILDLEEPLAGLSQIPEYSIDLSLSCRTGQTVPWTGVWVPANDMGTAALAFARQGQIMQPKYPITHVDEDDYEYTTPIETAWHPVKPTGRMISLNEPTEMTTGRIPAGESATQTGYWFTPAKECSRRYFKQGETFPQIEGSSYGATFWQWSPNQSNPSLGTD